jgi:hypothetical protein
MRKTHAGWRMLAPSVLAAGAAALTAVAAQMPADEAGTVRMQMASIGLNAKVCQVISRLTGSWVLSRQHRCHGLFDTP